jgi:hypothetical protein
MADAADVLQQPQIGLSDSCLELSNIALNSPSSRKAPLLRPPSYSDSFLVLGASVQPPTPTLEPLNVPLSAVRPRFDFVWWYEKCVSLMIHISLISLFETIFFFQFIAKSEDSGLLKTIDGYVGAVADSCSTWPANVTVAVNDFLATLVNARNVTAAAQVAVAGRSNFNHDLQVQSWLYFVGITGLTGLASAWAVWKKYKFHWRRVLIENIAMVTLLGIYEFVFFRTIIYNYVSLSMPEIDLHIVQVLGQMCGLFTSSSS